MFPEPDEGNGFLAEHVADLLRSHYELTGSHLITPRGAVSQVARLAYAAPVVLLSHDGADDPLLTYGNLAAQELFAMVWGKLVGTPSRETAEAPERAALMARYLATKPDWSAPWSSADWAKPKAPWISAAACCSERDAIP